MNNDTVTKVVAMIYVMAFAMCIMPACIGIGEEADTLNNPFDYARITDVDYKAELIDEPNNSGKVRVTERLTYDIHAASKGNLFWELWRDLPEDWVDGLHVNYDVLSVKEIKSNGEEQIYLESDKLYWDDWDYTSEEYGPGKWYHSIGPYDEYYGDYEAVFFYVDGLYREEVTFEVVYEMNNAALKYRDISELYLTLFSEDSVNYLESFDAQILIPDKDMPKDGNYTAYTLGTKDDSFEFKESDTMNPGYHTFYFNLDEEDLKFRPYNEYLDFVLWSYNEDSQIFTTYAPDNDYSWDVAKDELMGDYKAGIAMNGIMKTIKFYSFLGSLIASLIVIFILGTRDKKYKSRYHIFETPDILFYRDIPSDLDPHFVSKFIKIKDKNTKADDANGYSAILLNLVRKEYINLVESNYVNLVGAREITIVLKYRPQGFGNISKGPVVPLSYKPNIISQPTPVVSMDNANVLEKVNFDGKKLEPLTVGEEYYFNLIVKHAGVNTSITMSQFQRAVSNDVSNTDRFVTNMDKILVDVGVRKGYFQKRTYDEARKSITGTSTLSIVLGIIALILNLLIRNSRLDYIYGGLFILGGLLIIGGIYLRKLARKYVLLTRLGEQEYAKWKGLYNFLDSATLMNERTHIELPLWEKYLVYATAFGISEKVVKALEIRCPDLAKSVVLSNGYCRSSSFRSSGRSFSSSTRSASYSSRSSSGGGYYGGGGRGGGGGGGGH